MILKCKDSDLNDFTIGKRYICFGVQFNEYRNETKVSVRRDSDGTPVIVEISKFEVINPSIPEGFEISFYKQEDTTNTTIEPKEFSGAFWDDYHDGDPKMEKLFKDTYTKICKFHNFSITSD
ncbi:hypothetical protein MWMV17_MWMV17_02279 [Acinetobacter calcoaceticus]|uniref:Uncharacterized protein n=1 Tax=Acinetobacter calcoaceticus DSM 30006 = CIP 81.8 TaxID=981331 RepID=A0ABN0K880_ACICA|nr:hypothetical protein [Acinetobacter calcoaceticus]ENV99727.1 hypothetical protein F936_02813 [Acinetobacter calcoaceticus DSM 30006 = CIP 81.8]CAI3142959.1 hypothetical protein MWMV17_MWMV17_02279 [Acinetobacter calcoaceticus]SUU53007.1 Uncharacterised protein [Acinetobacter calcoaceticus]